MATWCSMAILPLLVRAADGNLVGKPTTSPAEILEGCWQHVIQALQMKYQGWFPMIDIRTAN